MGWDERAAGSAPADKLVVLSCRGRRRDFGGFTAVNDVDLDVRHGEVHALIGPNGAGKTTVFNLLTKFLQPTSGRSELLGQDIIRTKPAKVARMGLVRSFQISATFPHLTVLENVRVALLRPGGIAVQFWKPVSSLDRLNDRAMEILETVGLAGARDRLAADLSYGRKRVLELATTLALEPKVLLHRGRGGPRRAGAEPPARPGARRLLLDQRHDRHARPGARRRPPAPDGLPRPGWDDVLPPFRRSENHFGGADEMHGAGGE